MKEFAATTEGIALYALLGYQALAKGSPLSNHDFYRGCDTGMMRAYAGILNQITGANMETNPARVIEVVGAMFPHDRATRVLIGAEEEAPV